jgi:hypothetical protein
VERFGARRPQSVKTVRTLVAAKKKMGPWGTPR